MKVRASFILTALPALFIANAHAGWSLVWSDEFDGSGAVDPGKWNVEENANPPNNEAENYTKSLKNVHQDSGYLYLTAIRENVGGKSYTSGRINSNNKGSWTYGRIEARCKMGSGKGSWSAFWMLANNCFDSPSNGWPACGEIDIGEYVGRSANNVGTYLHYGGGNSGGTKDITDPAHTFHLYAVEWFADHIDGFFDSTKIFTYKNPNPNPNANQSQYFQQWPYYKAQNLIFDEAIGGGFGGNVDNTIFPTSLVVDYVRVYTQVATPVFRRPVNRERLQDPVLRWQQGKMEFIPGRRDFRGHAGIDQNAAWNAIGREFRLQ